LKGKNDNLVLVLLQDFGPKQKKEGYVNLVPSEGPKRSLDDDSYLYIVLKELHPKTYKFLSDMEGDSLVFESLEALRLAQVPYFTNLKDDRHIAQRGELLPMEIDYSPEMERAWHRIPVPRNFEREQFSSPEIFEMALDDKIEMPGVEMDERDENNEDRNEEGDESSEKDESDEACDMLVDCDSL
jgi:hypothetical protein